MKKQSQADREKRLADMRCPVHGTGLCQIDVDRLECPRGDCNIRFHFEPLNITAYFPDNTVLIVGEGI